MPGNWDKQLESLRPYARSEAPRFGLSPDCGDDAIQTVARRLSRSGRSAKGLKRAVRNALIDLARKQGRQPKSSLDDALEAVAAAPPCPPSAVVEAQETFARVGHAVAAHPCDSERERMELALRVLAHPDSKHAFIDQYCHRTGFARSTAQAHVREGVYLLASLLRMLADDSEYVAGDFLDAAAVLRTSTAAGWSNSAANGNALEGAIVMSSTATKLRDRLIAIRSKDEMYYRDRLGILPEATALVALMVESDCHIDTIQRNLLVKEGVIPPCDRLGNITELTREEKRLANMMFLDAVHKIREVFDA